ITGASGSIYAKLLLDRLASLQDQIDQVGVVMSDNAKDVWKFELGETSYAQYPFQYYSKTDFMAPFASGSAKFDTMIIVPSSMGTLLRIASRSSAGFATRAEDAMLDDPRELIFVTRQIPLKARPLRHMSTVTQAGGIVCPGSPSFYCVPQTIEEVAATVVDRVL